MAPLQLNQLSKSIGDEFQLTHPDGLRTIRLTEAKALREGGGEADGAPGGRPGGPFSLVFEGAADEVFQQGSYKIEHGAVGVFDIFLVPIGKTDNGFLYEAVFN